MNQPEVPQGPSEQREKPILEIWVIEDDDSIRESIVDAVGSLAEGSRCIGFEKAEDALRELEQKIARGKTPPSGIFVDGNLKKDTSSFNLGPLVVEKIRSLLIRDSPPFIVAISGETDLNNAMMQKGANLSAPKPVKMDVLSSALEKIKEAHKTNNP